MVDLLASAFLNDWVKRKYTLFRETFVRQPGGDEYQKLLHLFFEGVVVDVSSPARRSLPAAIDRWLSVLHIDFTAYQYSLTIKDLRRIAESDADDALDYTLSMDVITEENDEVIKTSLSKCADLEMLRAPTALSNYLPEIRSLAARKKVHLSEARLVAFLDSAAGLLTRLGMKVNLPKALARELKPRLAIKGKLQAGPLVSFLDLETLQNYWR